MRSMRLLWLVAALVVLALSASAQEDQESSQPMQESEGNVVETPASDKAIASWIATVDTVTKSGGQETRRQKKVWHKGLRERVEEDVEGGVRVTLIDAADGHRIVIEPGAKYAMKHVLPQSEDGFFEQRKSDPMARTMRKQGFAVTGPDEVDEEEILGISCVVRQLSAEPSAQMLQNSPDAPELIMIRFWEPKASQGLPAALKLSQITKGVNITEFIFTSLQRDPVIADTLFDVPEGMAVYEASKSVESVTERIQKTRDQYLKQKQEEESGGAPPDEDKDSGGESDDGP